MREKSIVAAIVRKNNLGEITALPDQEILCPITRDHEMRLCNTTGEWECEICSTDGDTFDLYSLAFQNPNMDYVRRLVWYYRTHLVPVPEMGRHHLFAHLEDLQIPDPLPKPIFAELSPYIKNLQNNKVMLCALQDLMNMDKDHIMKDRLGLIGSKRFHYIIWPNIEYGELQSYYLFDPYVNTVIGRVTKKEGMQWSNCLS